MDNLPGLRDGTQAPPRASQLFVNRDTPIALFKNAISRIDRNRARQVLVFHGVGGQGKTHLCRHLGAMLDEKSSEKASRLQWGMVDLHEHAERQAEYFLLWVRNAVKRTSEVAFPAFDLAFGLFWKEMHGSSLFHS